MSDTFQIPPASVPETVELPPVVWMGGHPTIADREPRGTRLRRCLLCNSRSSFGNVSCARGMTVHLIDTADVREAPEAFAASVWATPEAIAGAHAHWRDKGFVVTRKPDGPTGEHMHPRYRPCPACNEEAMEAGTLGPVYLASPAARTGRERGVRA